MASTHALLLTAVALLAGQQAVAQTLFTGRAPVNGNANAGQAVYAQACMVCHGPRLEGSPFAPGLIGQTFTGKWRGKPAAELLQQMRETMPPKGTGTVQPEVFPDLLAFLVQANVAGIPVAGNAPSPRFGGMPAAVVPAAAIPRPLTPEQARKLASLSPVTEALLAAPPEDAWLMWRRTFDAAGFSPLQQIHRGNVQRLRQAWTLPIDSSTNEITPLVHEGVLFVNSGVAVLAVDAATGTPLWRYQRETARSAAAAAGASTNPDAGGGAGGAAAAMRFNYGGNQQARVKSMAIYGHSLFVPTPDGSVVALDTRSGKLVWERALTGGAGANTGLILSSGPLVARGVVMIGASLGLTNKGGCFIVGLDAATGTERWRFHTVARPGTPGGDTWNDAPTEERFGAGVWTTGSFDPQLDLAYFGVGNTYTTATLLEARPGASGVTRNDGLFTNATIALRPETGELVWYHQHHRRDVWDQDWAFEQTLVTLGSGANAKRAVVTGGKTAVFEAVDAATGKFLFAQDTGLTNLFLSVDAATGEKRMNPALEPVAGRKLLLCPSNLGARNWPATTLNPGTGMLFIPMVESCADFTYEPRSHSETAGGGSDIRFSPQNRPDSDGKFGRMMAIDLATQRVQWTHRQTAPLASSLLATAGGVVFMGDLARNFGAYDQASGQALWNTQLPAAAESTPVTYAVGGRQFIAVVSGEGSHLGTQHRRLDSTLATPKRDIALVVFALPAN